jgi:hypothetical protein
MYGIDECLLPIEIYDINIKWYAAAGIKKQARELVLSLPAADFLSHMICLTLT